MESRTRALPCPWHRGGRVPSGPRAAMRGRGGRGRRRIFEDHAMRHLQRLPVLVGDEAGLNEEAIERPQRQGERQQRRWRGHTCGGEAGPSWVPRGPPPAPPLPARPDPAYRRLAARRPRRPSCTAPTAACGAARPPASAPAVPRPPPPAGACATAGGGTAPALPSGPCSEPEAGAAVRSRAGVVPFVRARPALFAPHACP